MVSIDSFMFPEGVAEALKAQGRQNVSIGDGVERFTSGHDRGVAFRFFVEAEYNPAKSKLAGYEVFDEVEMIEWRADSRNRPTERVRFLPEELLLISPDGDVVTGRYSESYRNWKAGRTQPGLPISKWGVLSDGEVATLAKMGIFTVEQFAEVPRNKVRALPQVFQEALDRAGQYVAGKTNRVDAAKAAEEMLVLQKQNNQLQSEVAELRKLITGSAPAKRGRPRKDSQSTDSIVIEG